MKNYLFLFKPLIILFLSCVKNTQSDVISNEIRTVETSLTYPFYIYGDSTWTIESRMKHYGVPGVKKAASTALAIIFIGVSLSW